MRQPQSRLLLIPGTGDSPDLAERIQGILSETYGMGNSVEVHAPLRPGDVEKGTPKAHTYPLVVGSFNDGETRVDCGRNDLMDRIRGKHVAIVKYMFTPKREGISINDHIMEVRGLLGLFSNTDILQATLVAPYLPYLRSHSIEKYRKKGFFQFDSLKHMLNDFDHDGLGAIVCIDPHSDKLMELASQYGMRTPVVNPFESSIFVNPAKLGLNGNQAADVLKKLQPWIEYFREVSTQYKNLYVVSADDGAETRVERFLVYCKMFVQQELGWQNIGYRDKFRATIEKAIATFKPFSLVNLSNVDPDGIYIVPDDMFDSGGTCDDIAKSLKDAGAKRVEAWITHPLAPDREKVKGLSYIDKIVALDTILHHNPEELNIHYIRASADLLAAQLYKEHMRLEADRFRV
ncbi:ribose-phosphate pyrophosphokinase-like domain-containing protein [Candidatus Woesearchaeota archaeon]|nr:ribose-phosphate pyrophosphokinase-like domain-containing protein [Candidatus Woesearchaeota archaeon]